MRKRTIKVKPFEHEPLQGEPPANLPGTPWADYEQWVMVESSTGQAYLIDGMSDQGFGDAMVYARICKSKFGAVESTLIEDFRRLLTDDFNLIGSGEAAIRYVRTLLDNANKVSVNTRSRAGYMRRKCSEYATRSRTM